jgi:hypothetical protein
MIAGVKARSVAERLAVSQRTAKRAKSRKLSLPPRSAAGCVICVGCRLSDACVVLLPLIVNMWDCGAWRCLVMMAGMKAMWIVSSQLQRLKRCVRVGDVTQVKESDAPVC